MPVTQLEKTLLEYTKGLPADALQEILDFARFIRQKKAKQQENNLSTRLYKVSKEQSMHLEEEFQNYKQIYPIE